jgi:hypothetical protein
MNYLVCLFNFTNPILWLTDQNLTIMLSTYIATAVTVSFSGQHITDINVTTKCGYERTYLKKCCLIGRFLKRNLQALPYKVWLPGICNLVSDGYN